MAALRDCNANVYTSGVSDTIGGVTVVGGPLATLAVGATDDTTFTGSYAITQADIDAGSFYNLATATSKIGRASCRESVELPENADIENVKSGVGGDGNHDGFAQVVESIS